MPQTVIAFDLFGTILSTDSIAQKLGEIYGKDDATRIATEARRLQLEYTWRCVSMGRRIWKWALERLLTVPRHVQAF